MEEAKEKGIGFILGRRMDDGDAVMFDIDETLIFMDGDRPNRPIIELARLADMVGYEVIIITARPGTPENKQFTKEQLDREGIPYDLIVFTAHEAKGEVKKRIGKKIILSVGDMWTDVTESEHWIKLPTPYDPELKTSSAYHSSGRLRR
jgi:predicted secreted acid phosphatase